MARTLDNLKKNTKLFFEFHWQKNKGLKIPEWSEPWDLNTSIPNGHLQGCYAFFNTEDQVIYIGVGASKKLGIDADAGIGSRVGRYKRVNNNANASTKYKFTELWYKRNVKELRTIGFPSELRYLSYALEVFLIIKLDPLHNATHKTK